MVRGGEGINERVNIFAHALSGKEGRVLKSEANH